MKTLYRKAHVKNGSYSFEWEISTFKIVNALINQLVGSERRDSLWDAATWSDRHFWVLPTTINPCE